MEFDIRVVKAGNNFWGTLEEFKIEAYGRTVDEVKSNIRDILIGMLENGTIKFNVKYR